MSMHPTNNYFKDHPNDYFVETGSYRGDGIQFAVEAGFQRIYSIDLFKANIDFCVSRFDLTPRFEGDSLGLQGKVRLFQGDSAIMLRQVIGGIPKPITFFLDAHTQMLEDEPECANPFPLIAELGQIAEHPIKTHTIIIDDMLIMQYNICGCDKILIETLINKINPDYKFKYLSNPVKNSILIAYV